MIKRSIAINNLALALFAASFLAVVALNVKSASARQGSDDVSRQATQQSNTELNDEAEDETTTPAKTRVAELKNKAKQEIEKEREGRKTLAEDKRKLVCENRQKAIENKLVAFNQAADKHLVRLNGVFDKVQAYKGAENINPDGWAELVSAAEAKKTAATDAVAALKLVAVAVDCTDPDTVVKLSEVREAAKSTRTELHDYRKALKDMVVALAQAKDDVSGNDDNAGTGDDTAANPTAGENTAAETNTEGTN
ncbi:hypothetical protein IPL85_05610 [Candidatus Saccharibacteria bacterium]|nr:MAG: hypothetical protein IPL85_05610 [Candidatus Saccharibacteria bacterium]